MKIGFRGGPWRVAGWVLTLSGGLGAGPLAAAPNVPLAPAASADGHYTVTPRGCNDHYAQYECLATWLEERIEPGGVFEYTSGTFTSKPPGVYTYRSVDMYCDSYYYAYCETRYSGTVSVTVGNAPSRDPLDVQLSYTFRARVGNVVGDAGTDILVERVAGGEPGNGVIDAVVLRQGAQRTFTPIVPTSAQRTSTAWASSNLEVKVEDINADGFVDVVVDEIDSAIAGAHDQIVYSSGVPLNPTPKGSRAIDADLAQFTGNMLDYMVDNDYFAETAPLVSTLVYYSIPYCPLPYESYGYQACYPVYLYYYVVVPDYSVFDSSAVEIWQRENALTQGALSRAQAVDQIASRVAAKIGVEIGGWDLKEIFGNSGPNEDPLWKKGLDAFIAIIGIGTAHADETETDKAPRQITRQPDVIYITGRYVFGSGNEKLHSSVYYRSTAVAIPTWYSAFDSDRSLLGDGKLVAMTNDPRDAPLLMRFTLGTVKPPYPLSAASYFFADMGAAHGHYHQLPEAWRADYDAIPEVPDCGGCAGRNSNGYVNGLVRATKGTAQPLPPFDFNDLFGWEYPVEPFYFGR